MARTEGSNPYIVYNYTLNNLKFLYLVLYIKMLLSQKNKKEK